MQKPKGEMKVKVGLRADRGRMGRVTYAARTPGRLVLIARRGAPRAYTLGPERW